MLGPLAHGTFFMAPPLRAKAHVLAPLSKYRSRSCALLHSLPPLGPSPSHHLLAPTGFCHMYNLADYMVELKHNTQTSKEQWFLFVLESSVS